VDHPLHRRHQGRPGLTKVEFSPVWRDIRRVCYRSVNPVI
jgi:hypothetical protein